MTHFSALLGLAFFALSHVQSDPGLELHLFPNTELWPPATSVTTIPSLDYTITPPSSLSNQPISTEILGTLTFPKNNTVVPLDLFYFKCNFDPSLYGFIWIDDHLICADTVYPNQPKTTQMNVTWLRTIATTRQAFFRATLYTKNIAPSYSFSLKWSINNESFQEITSDYLSTKWNENHKNICLQQFII